MYRPLQLALHSHTKQLELPTSRQEDTKKPGPNQGQLCQHASESLTESFPPVHHRQGAVSRPACCSPKHVRSLGQSGAEWIHQRGIGQSENLFDVLHEPVKLEIHRLVSQLP